MTSATVTSKGQVTIPVDVRTKLGLRPESWLAYVTKATGGSEIHLQAASIQDLKGAVPRPSEPRSPQVVAASTSPMPSSPSSAELPAANTR